ncbi:MAG: YbaN family protein [Candidatus Nanopelagicales bacterium]
MRWVWISLGVASVAAGAVAAVLPLVPTTPFLLVAAFAFARSSDRFHRWLTEHPRLGPPIRDWHAGRLVHRSAKRLATASIALAFAVSVVIGLPLWVLAVQAVVLSGVVAYIWSRPEPPAVDVRLELATADAD